MLATAVPASLLEQTTRLKPFSEADRACRFHHSRDICFQLANPSAKKLCRNVPDHSLDPSGLDATGLGVLLLALLRDTLMCMFQHLMRELCNTDVVYGRERSARSRDSYGQSYCCIHAKMQ